MKRRPTPRVLASHRAYQRVIAPLVRRGYELVIVPLRRMFLRMALLIIRDLATRTRQRRSELSPEAKRVLWVAELSGIRVEPWQAQMLDATFRGARPPRDRTYSAVQAQRTQALRDSGGAR